jgi:hypothetical protein
MYIFFKMDVLLFSKFSESSTKLLKQLEKTPELLESFNIVCIDNKKIRTQILNDKKVKVKNVPCLIHLNDQTNNFDIFENQNVFDYFTNLQKQIEQLKIEEENLFKLKQQEIFEKDKLVEQLKKELDDEKKKSVSQSISQIISKPTFTPIEDLEDKRMSSINTYTHIDKNENSDFDDREILSKKADSTISKNEGGNLLAKAMRMQKERDSK